MDSGGCYLKRFDLFYEQSFSELLGWSFSWLNGSLMESKPKHLFNVFSADGCDPIPTIANAEPNTTLVDAETVIEYECNTGHVFNASVTQYTILCQNEIWNHSQISCEGIQNLKHSYHNRFFV